MRWVMLLLVVSSALAAEGTSAPSAFSGLVFSGTIENVVTESMVKEPAVPITLVFENETVQSAWFKEKGFQSLQCKPGGFSGKHFSVSAEIKNERREEARLSIEVDDFKELRATFTIIYADLKSKTWLIKAKIEKK